MVEFFKVNQLIQQQIWSDSEQRLLFRLPLPPRSVCPSEIVPHALPALQGLSTQDPWR